MKSRTNPPKNPLNNKVTKGSKMVSDLSLLSNSMHWSIFLPVLAYQNKCIIILFEFQVSLFSEAMFLSFYGHMHVGNTSKRVPITVPPVEGQKETDKKEIWILTLRGQYLCTNQMNQHIYLPPLNRLRRLYIYIYIYCIFIGYAFN